MKSGSKLREDPTWKEAMSLADFMHKQASRIEDDHLDEKYGLPSRLKSSANDVLNYVSQATTMSTPRGEAYEWLDAKKFAFSMQSMYILASKQELIELDPKIIVRIDELINNINTKLDDWEKAKASQT